MADNHTADLDNDEVCDTDGCEQTTGDGEGYAGRCGSCADKLTALEEAGDGKREMVWEDLDIDLATLDKWVSDIGEPTN